MKPFLDFFTNILKNEKKKILTAVLAFFIFLILAFPYSDLADVVTAQVSKLTGNQVYLQFDDMGVGVIPTPSITFRNVQVDTPTLPTLKTASLSIAPSIAALLTFNMGVTVRAEDFLKGNVYANYKTGKSKDGDPLHQIKLEIEQLELKEAKQLVNLPIKLDGVTDVDLNLDIDPTFKDQPSGEFELNIRSLIVPASTIPTKFGPIDLPAVKFTNARLKGRLVAGSLIIEEGTLGTTKDDLFSGRIKGSIALQLRKSGPSVLPIWGAYDLKIILNLKKDASHKFGLFLSLINDKYKAKTNSGLTYQFKMSATRFGKSPRFSDLGKF